MIRLFAIFVIYCMIIGCKPKECFKNTGSIQKIKKEVGYFKSVWTEDNISVELVKGKDIFLEAGENLITSIDFNLRSDSSLVISNKNSCSWFRSYDIPVKVYVGIDNINYINWRSYGSLTSEKSLPFGYLQLDIFDVNPQINLDIEAIGLFVYSNSGAGIILQGKSNELSVFTRGYGKIDASNLATNRVQIKHQGQNNILIQPIEVLVATLESSGNLIYNQEPKEKKITITGSGKIIKQ